MPNMVDPKEKRINLTCRIRPVYVNWCEEIRSEAQRRARGYLSHDISLRTIVEMVFDESMQRAKAGRWDPLKKLGVK